MNMKGFDEEELKRVSTEDGENDILPAFWGPHMSV